ncbi:MAG: sulfite exporter TauE/SafE family protein [Opitutales bacterium]|tara:strand:+ start:434 stop:1180 length:747 start_codon:yes stop_codon:yes gene_type:complete
MIILSILFFVTAILYASVGFGGGSTYLALLLLWGIPYFIFPVLALTCNIIVVSGNCFNYIRAGNLNLKLITPYLIGSIPLAFIGGSLPVEKEFFEILLFVVLTIAGVMLLFKFNSYDDKIEIFRKIPIIFSILIGSILGFVSGVVGVGGGIFLSPILFLLRAGKPKHIVTTSSLFILINSLSGIFGQLTKSTVLSEIQNYWFLFLAALIGGQIGNFLNLKIFPTRILALVTAALVLFVAIRMAFKIFI